MLINRRVKQITKVIH